MQISLRESFGQALAELGQAHSDVVVLNADLASASKTDLFAAQFPERHINCGIAEENMLSAAAGLSACNLVPFVSGFAMFTVCRAYEQIRNSIGYPHLNVKIAATHAGISVGEDGATHQCCEDIALMRAVSGMSVLCPCDDAEVRAAVAAAYDHTGPVYLRLSRAAAPNVHESQPLHFEIGKGETLRDGTDVALIACGLMVSRALEAAQLLATDGISARVLNFSSIKPLDEQLLLRAAQECGAIVTCEEHSIIGGLGEAVASYLGEHYPVPLCRVGVRDRFGSSAPASELFSHYGLDASSLCTQVKSLLLNSPFLQTRGA